VIYAKKGKRTKSNILGVGKSQLT